MNSRTCSIDGCTQPLLARGWCQSHYRRWRRSGDPVIPPLRSGTPVDHADGTRTCTRCLIRQDLNDFSPDRLATAGRRGVCKDCRSVEVSGWYARNQERQRDRQRDRYERNGDAIRVRDQERYERDKAKRLELVVAAGHRRRALLKGLPAVRGITVRALRKRDGELCCYCGNAMTFVPARRGQFLPLKATLEHVVPLSAGGSHDWSNVMLACWQCNLDKNRQPLNIWREKRGRDRTDPSALRVVP